MFVIHITTIHNFIIVSAETIIDMLGNEHNFQ